MLNPGIAVAPLRRYGVAAALVDDDDEYWENDRPSSVMAAEADGHMIGRGVQWVFIGSPGVEKSAYASKVAKLLNVPHISMGNICIYDPHISFP
jgi:adenylate kinase